MKLWENINHHFQRSYFALYRVFDGLTPLLAGVMNIVGIALALAVFIHRRVHGNDDAALNLISPESSAMTSMASSSAASTAGTWQLKSISFKYL